VEEIYVPQDVLKLVCSIVLCLIFGESEEVKMVQYLAAKRNDTLASWLQKDQLEEKAMLHA